MNKLFLFFLAFGLSYLVNAQGKTYDLQTDIHYYNDDLNKEDTYINERCVLDIYYPKDSLSFATIVWFHGGGLSSGQKEIPEALKEKGVAVIAVNYRLYPKIGAPIYIEDAAASVAWAFNNIEKYGGDSQSIFISVHSAGGYLASMIGLDKRWLQSHDIDANDESCRS